MTFLLGCLLSTSFALQASAQEPVRHELIRGDLPPGEAAWFYQQADPSLVGHMQAVQLIAPGDTTVEIGDAASSFGQAQATQMTVEMGIGYVYRFKLSNFPIPDTDGQTLYPSIEVIGKLSPPAGLEKDFPIQVVVTRDDINLALTGRMVTRVIYLEDPREPLPFLHTEAEQPSTDVRRGQDPLRAAQKLGRPMAILRMGSRVPMQDEVAEWFTFGVAGPRVLPNPRPANAAGLNERELRIVKDMEQAEAQARMRAKAQSNFEAVGSRTGQSKPTDQFNKAGFRVKQTDQPLLRIPPIIKGTGGPYDRFSPVASPSSGVPMTDSTTANTSQPQWSKVNVLPEPPVERSRINNVIPVPATPTASSQLNATPPAPSLVNFRLEPTDPIARDNDIAPEAQPLLMPLRRPNEL